MKDTRRSSYPSLTMTLILAAIFLLGVISLSKCNANDAQTKNPTRDEHMPALFFVGGDLYYIRKALHKEGVDLSALDKLDFSLPNEAKYGDHPDLEVFNPAGKIKATPVNQADLNNASSAVGTKVLFSLRRVENSTAGTIEENLYGVVPQLTEDACSDYAEHTIFMGDEGEKKPAPSVLISHDLSFEPDNHKTVIDPEAIPNKGACIQTPDKKLFFFLSLAKRFKKNEGDSWQTK